MGDPACKRPDCLHFLGLMQLILKVFSFRLAIET